MVNTITLKGAIILNDNEDIMAMTVLLTSAIRDKIKYFRYNHANEIDLSHKFDFVVTRDLNNVPSIAKAFRRKGQNVPRIIHLATEEDIEYVNYDDLYAGVRVTPILQAELDQMDITLNYDTFSSVMEQLLKAKLAVSSGS